MPKLITVAQLSQQQPAFTQVTLRWLLSQSKENGLEESGAIVRLNRRILIDEEKFAEWVRLRGAASTPELPTE